MNVREVASAVVTLCTILLWLTGIPTCRKILQQGNTSNVSFFPFLCMFCGSVLWTKYGLVKLDLVVFYMSLGGAAVNLLFMMIYYVYTYQKGFLHKQMSMGGLLLFPILLYIKYYSHSKDDTLQYLGIYCSIFSVLCYGAPLTSVADVVKSKSTECMSFYLSLANFIVAGEWFYYGVLIQDIYIKVPNFIGTFLGLLQVILFCIYPRTKSDNVTRKGTILKT